MDFVPVLWKENYAADAGSAHHRTGDEMQKLYVQERFYGEHMKIDKTRRLYEKTMIERHVICHDDFGHGNEFEFYFKISKVYTLSGIYYRTEIPNFFTYDKNMTEAIWRVIKELHDCGMRYERLRDMLIRKDIWRKL